MIVSMPKKRFVRAYPSVGRQNGLYPIPACCMVAAFETESTRTGETFMNIFPSTSLSAHRLMPMIGMLILWLFFLSGPAPAAEQGTTEVLFSIDFQDKPLKRALTEISWITGYSFLINREYADHKVSGKLENVTIHRGLKELVGDLNHTIIYEPDNTISLIIYDRSPPEIISDPLVVEAPLDYRVGSNDELPEEPDTPPTETDSKTASSTQAPPPGEVVATEEEPPETETASPGDAAEDGEAPAETADVPAGTLPEEAPPSEEASEEVQ